MKLSGEYSLAAQRQEVWNALNNIRVLRESIPGCESLEEVSENEMLAMVRTRLGPVNALFKTEIHLRNIDAPTSYTLVAKGKGGSAGIGEGIAAVSLVEAGADTILRYEVDFHVHGKLAQIGSRLMVNTLQKLSRSFFSNFSSKFAAASSASDARSAR